MLLIMPVMFPCNKEIDVPFNRRPIASAGFDRTVILPENATGLDGTKSYDPDNRDRISSYKWTKVSGPEGCIINNANGAITTVRNLSEGNYVFELEVKDRLGSSARDSVVVNVIFRESPPYQVFENLTWVVDSVNNMLYMQTPPIVGKHSVDDISSVALHMYDFDYRGYMWRNIERDGTTIGHFYYRIENDTVVVYMYFTPPLFDYGYIVERKIEVTFGR